MKEFRDRVAVITGAASGIGRALAERCVQEGMRVVLADVEEQALAHAAQELSAAGAGVLAVRTDVSRAEDVEMLARKTLAAFGAVHLLCNNAGVGGGTTIWESTLADWQWVLGVNLWGVLHGVRVFVPVMLAQDIECHILNTASIAGLLPYHASAPYQVTKHAVVALSEHLHYSLAERKAKVKVSVLCPGWVNTRIMDSERNRPAALRDTVAQTSAAVEAVRQEMRQAALSGMAPAEVADQAFAAIRAEQLYVLTHPDLNAYVQQRLEHILQEAKPV